MPSLFKLLCTLVALLALTQAKPVKHQDKKQKATPTHKSGSHPTATSTHHSASSTSTSGYGYTKSKEDKIYGVNLGGWLLFEPWMATAEWAAMGGDGQKSEWDLVKHLKTDKKMSDNDVTKVFSHHWDTWLTEEDIVFLKNNHINTVRIPLGFWIIEELVDEGEYYPKGGLTYLRRGLEMLRRNGIKAILVHHALPGSAASKQAFSGHWTTNPQFYKKYNYERALTWTAIMTSLCYLDPYFQSVYAIEAINEPLMDSSRTDGLKEFYTDFTNVIHTVENSLTRILPDVKLDTLLGDLLKSVDGIASSGDNRQPSKILLNLKVNSLHSATNHTKESTNGDDSKSKIDKRSTPVQGLPQIQPVQLLGVLKPQNRAPITPVFMDYSWQHGKSIANAADAYAASQSGTGSKKLKGALSVEAPSNATYAEPLFDDHNYYCYNNVHPRSGQSKMDAYIERACKRANLKTDSQHGQNNVVTGEWSIATDGDVTHDKKFLKKFADAQKWAYSQGAGWIIWNFKNGKDQTSVSWSYKNAVDEGYFGLADEIPNSSVCNQPYWD